MRSPSSDDVTSRFSDSCTSRSIVSAMDSMRSMGTGRLMHAMRAPRMSFCRSNGSRPPSFLTTVGRMSSTRS